MKNSIGMEFVKIPGKNFMMQTTPVTQRQWKEVMGNNPSHFKDCDECPVENVSWDDAQEFIRKLNDLEGSDQYRLPTETEWEYSCRAGSTTTYYFGDNPDQLEEYAWYEKNSDGKTHPVAQLKPNTFGLYDMLGNIWEWCQDWDSIEVNYKVLRGGSWLLNQNYMRCANRLRYFPDLRNSIVGFRCAMSCETQENQTGI